MTQPQFNQASAHQGPSDQVASDQVASDQAGRREFLKTAATVAATGPLILGASRKTDPKNPIVGQGEHTYECFHDWGELPQGALWGEASHGVTIDKAGMIYITHYGKPGSIFVFDPQGKFVKSMGDFHTQGGLGRGHGIDIRQEGNQEFLYLSSSSPLGWAKMDLQGELVWKKGIPEESGKYKEKNPRFRPTNASFGPKGDYYLGDGYGSNYIHHYDKDDNYLGTFGGTGRSNGQFRTPHGQWLDDRDGTPKVVIVDRANKRLQYFTLEGKWLSTLGGFLFPADIDIQGEIMLVPDLHARITLLDKDNKVIVHLGDDPEWTKKVTARGFPIRRDKSTWKPGKFIHPHDACFDREGNIFVAEWVRTGRVTKLQKVS